MISNNYFSDNEDLKDHFDSLTDWKEIVDSYEENFTDYALYQKTSQEELAYAPGNYEDAIEFYRSTLEAGGDIAGKDVSQVAKQMDEVGLKYKDGKVTFPKEMIDVINKIKSAGLLPYGIHRHYGGIGLPSVVQSMLSESVSRADGGLAITLGCMNLAETVERFGTEEMIHEFVPKMAAGELCGAMALTEPNYGSDLPNLQTKAVKGEDGVWKITGTKRFITHACGFDTMPSIILTLARTGSTTSGARGLSFFLVHSKDIFVASIEKKMGLHCSPTCEVVFENSPGILIGDEGKGLVKYSMAMMNQARLNIAAQAMGIATAAYFEGRKYATERVQFGKTIDQIPAVKKMLDRMEREIAGMRCILYEASRSVDLYRWKEERGRMNGIPEKEIRKDETFKRWEKLASLLTPLSKYYITELANVVASDALQIHGGSGYTEDYDVARIYRDVRITNIYEGTTQLQVVACIGSIVAGMTETGIFREYIKDEMSKFKVSDELKELWSQLETIVSEFAEIGTGTLREELAFEVVESAARLLVSLLLERSVPRAKVERRASRKALAQDYVLDSSAILLSNLTKIKGKKKSLAAV
ncbi:acyl-CoA dehydrogenase family protein [Leptospira ilyithenensis]|uniref:Acyl-CoA dehydrogenase n=1 Tax=Leptospira ilyithenensis TaxID=2484901 RepID=A0A4R9LQR0_9LEPT|nr:acyl-CoA dehydrogenase family protein [Leptospira ilyithenensis]TGN10092.1 acyl-CoA dehydrogenase [Leptospira ilyithenensis]